MGEKRKKILIIGAGPSGLVAAKEAIDNGLDPIIFEKNSGIGGLWNPVTGSVWPSMHTNLSKFSCSFTGFPWPDEADMFPSSGEMFNYLSRYVEHFELSSRIRFSHTVLKIYKLDSVSESDWIVEWLDNENQSNRDIFHAVIICTGIFSGSYIPDIPGLQKFKGRRIHSKNYKGGDDFKDQIVLVIGGSISGEQIASDCSNHAKQVIHSFRKPFWLVSTFLPKDSTDPESQMLPVDLLFYNRKFYGQPQQAEVSDKVNAILKRNRGMNMLCQSQQSIPELCIPETDFTDTINVTITEHYLDSVKKGRINPIRGNIARFDANKVIFESGEELGVDAVVFCTGFHVNIPFLSETILDILQFKQDDTLQPLILYNATLHPELANMYFVGMYKGPFFGVMELQAKWSCRLLSGKVSLPSGERIAKGLEAEIEIRTQRPRPQFPHGDYVKFADEIAELANSLPDFTKFKEESLSDSLAPDTKDINDLEEIREKIYDAFMTGPVIPEHYDIFENPRSAWKQIEKVAHIFKGCDKQMKH